MLQGSSKRSLLCCARPVLCLNFDSLYFGIKMTFFVVVNLYPLRSLRHGNTNHKKITNIPYLFFKGELSLVAELRD